MFGKRDEWKALSEMINAAAKSKSDAQKLYYRVLDEALNEKIPVRDGNDKIIVDGKSGKPLMMLNPIVNRIRAIFTQASFSNNFNKVNPRYIKVLMREKKFAEILQGANGREGHLKELEGHSRTSIALIMQILSVNIMDLSSSIQGMVDTMSRKDDDLGI
ncbi:MAG: hypothetical protein ACFFCI_02230 [Promethearchaeota archaeon]